MRTAIFGPPTVQVGGLRVSRDTLVPWAPRFIDLPCSMLVRDFAACTSERWTQIDQGYLLKAPKGSVALIEAENPEAVVATLRSAGPKSLQVFAAALAMRSRGIREFSAAGLRLPGNGSGGVFGLLEAITRVRFLSGPASWRGTQSEPGPLLCRVNSGSAARGFALGDEWLSEFSAKERRLAKLPTSFLELHAKNDRYTLLLGWHLAIMLRVNRKYGFHYRVTLRTLLDGAGVDLPHRNVGRFLAAIYRSVDAIPGVMVSAPPHALYSCTEILDSKFGFTARPELVAEYATERAI